MAYRIGGAIRYRRRIERGTQTVIKTRDARRMRPLRLILEKKNGDEKTSGDGLRKMNCFYT